MGPGQRRGSWWCVVSLWAILAVLALAGCGSGSEQELVIQGDESFAGVPNPGTLDEAIQRFGPPDELYATEPESNVMCRAEWRPDGIKAMFRNLAAEPFEPPCSPHKDFLLIGARLSGEWQTDRGLRVGDGAELVEELYGDRKRERCYNVVDYEETGWILMRVADPLGGPGAYLCTLGVMVVDRQVTGFLISSRSASE